MLFLSDKKSRMMEQLPLHILEIILERLSFADCIRLSVVSKSWRSIVKQANNSRSRVPWLLLPFDQCSRSVRFFDMIEDRIYHIKLPDTIRGHCWGCSEGWLVIAHGKEGFLCTLFDPDVILYNPISRAQLRLPPLINSELKQIKGDYAIDKIDLLFPPNAASGSCVVAASFLGLKFIGLCRPEDNYWSVVEIDAKDAVADFLFYEGILYALITSAVLDKPKTAFATHTVTMGDSKIIVKLLPCSIFCVPFDPCPMSSFLVKSSSGLLVIFENRFRFKVFKFYESGNRVTRVLGLGDPVLFLTQRKSLSVSTRALDGLAGPCNNNIFFIGCTYTFGIKRFLLTTRGREISFPRGLKIWEYTEYDGKESFAAWFSPNIC